MLPDADALLLLIHVGTCGGIERKRLVRQLEGKFDDIENTVTFLESSDLIFVKKNSLCITEEGRRMVDVLKYCVCDLTMISESINDRYVLGSQIGSGDTSIVFKAVKKETAEEMAIKIFRPGKLKHVDITRRMRALSDLRSLPAIILPSDSGKVEWNEVCETDYVVMEYVEGRTLEEFFESRVEMKVQAFLENFFREIGRAVEIMERTYSIHDDLHSRNILVVEDEVEKTGIYHFKMIDCLGVNVREDFPRSKIPNSEYFKRHLLDIVRLYASTPSGEPDLEKLGSRYFNVIEGIQNEKYETMKELLYAALHAETPLSQP